ncbi:hypothetical protein [Ilumatobacter sp.]|uniref:hypothetical protein n=1 Tax=Ilumatobacter sp. TaxID=1967498 RepID=UPI003C317EDC
MLTLSQNAATLLAETRSAQGISGDSTLRVARTTQGEERGISLGFVDAPHTGDHTGSSHGMPICVEPEVAVALDAVTIDVDTAGDVPELVLVQDD